MCLKVKQIFYLEYLEKLVSYLFFINNFEYYKIIVEYEIV